jgi:hypothetical protein
MKNSKLSSLLNKLEELSNAASNDQFSVMSLTNDLSRTLIGGKYSSLNGTCTGSNASCGNGTCTGTVNTSCSNHSC